MRRKRRASIHQKQIRHFTLFFGGVAVLLVVALLWLMNHPHIPKN